MQLIRENRLHENRTTGAIILNMFLAAVSLFVNGFGVYLTIQANQGAAPWDVLNLGVSHSLGMLYGNASVSISLLILLIDILLKEPIGIAMFIDAVVVGKAVDFFNWINAVPAASSRWQGILMLLIGLVILAYTQYAYMMASLEVPAHRRTGDDRRADRDGLHPVHLHDRLPGLRPPGHTAGWAVQKAEKTAYWRCEHRPAQYRHPDRLAFGRSGWNRNPDLRLRYRSHYAICFSNGKI